MPSKRGIVDNSWILSRSSFSCDALSTQSLIFSIVLFFKHAGQRHSASFSKGKMGGNVLHQHGVSVASLPHRNSAPHTAHFPLIRDIAFLTGFSDSY